MITFNNVNESIRLVLSIVVALLFSVFFAIYAGSTTSLVVMALSIVLILLGGKLRLLSVLGFVYGNLIVVCLYEYYKSKYGVDFPYYLGGSDDLHYEMNALIYAQEYKIRDYFMIKGDLLPQWHNSPGYIYIVALQAKLANVIGEYNTLIPRIYNIFFLALTSIISYKFSRERLQLSEKSSQLVMIAIFSVPLMVYFSSHIYRDIIVTTLFVHIFYLLTARKITLFIAIAIGVELAILSQLRFLSFALMFVFVAIGVFDNLKNKALKISLILLVFLLLIYLSITFNILDLLSYYNSGYTEYRLNLTDGMAQKIFSLPLGLSVIPRLLYLSVIPVPNFSLDFVRIFLSVGTTIQMFFIPFMVAASYRILKSANKNAKKVLVVFTVLYFGLAMTSFAERQLLMLYPFAIFILVYGWEKNGFIIKNKKAIAWISFFLVFSMVAFYNLILAR